MANSGVYRSSLMPNNVEAGKTAAEEMLRRFKERGLSEDEEAQVAIQIGSTGSQTITDRVNGFTEYWEANAPEAWTILSDDIKVNDGDISKAVGFCQDYLTTYLYRGRDHMWQVLDSEIGDEFLAALGGTGLVGLSWYDAGARHFYNDVRPVQTLEDLAGLRIRVAQSQLMYDMVRALGATPVTVTYDEVYSALETGAIDGAENNWPSYESKQHWEVAPYITLDAHNRIPELQLCAQSTWNRLSEDDRAVITACARESALYERELWAEVEAAAREKLERDGGCTVTELDDDELARFREAVQPLYDEYAAGYKDLVARIAAVGQ